MKLSRRDALKTLALPPVMPEVLGSIQVAHVVDCPIHGIQSISPKALGKAQALFQGWVEFDRTGNMVALEDFRPVGETCDA